MINGTAREESGPTRFWNSPGRGDGRRERERERKESGGRPKRDTREPHPGVRRNGLCRSKGVESIVNQAPRLSDN